MVRKTFSAFFCAVAVSAVAFVAQPTTVQAQSTPGYWQSSGGDVKSGFGLCWRAGYWTPQMATAACDPDLVPKKAPAAAPVASAAPAAPAAPKPPPAAPQVEKVTLKGDTLFDFDKSVVKPEGKVVLDRLADQAKSMNLEVVVAVGHADWTGPAAYNQKLSERRAEAVKAYLVSKGIPAGKVYTEGKGETQPIADNKTREGRAQNRRVEVEVIGTRSK
jgi:OOP family OmpA-OmpF porin